jgi:hypothetical protein
MMMLIYKSLNASKYKAISTLTPIKYNACAILTPTPTPAKYGKNACLTF